MISLFKPSIYLFGYLDLSMNTMTTKTNRFNSGTIDLNMWIIYEKQWTIKLPS